MMTEDVNWRKGLKFRSIDFTQNYLAHNYEAMNFKESEKLSYENCYRFIYYLEHGEKYYNQVDVAPIELHPILLFYGMVQLLKACIVVIDPFYPENSQVLAHGVSTRKRKKSEYQFLDDEVKIQKHGLLSHFSEKMFHMKHFSGEKYKMRQLLRQIPELFPLFSDIEKMKNPYLLRKEEENNKFFSISHTILDHYQFGPDSFFSFLSTRSKQDFKGWHEKDSLLMFELKQPLHPLYCSPFVCSQKGTYFLTTNKEDMLALPEVVTHYLILYNLSMICRYETEWWGELFHYFAEKDYPFIVEFLSVSKEKIPYLLLLYLESLQN